jgi:hypothetical protein
MFKNSSSFSCCFAFSDSAFVKCWALALLPVPLQVHPAGLHHPVPGRAPAQMVERLLPLHVVMVLQCIPTTCRSSARSCSFCSEQWTPQVFNNHG